MKNKFVSFLIIMAVFFSVCFTPIMASAKSVTMDEATFNKLVTAAKEAEILEKEKNFYKQKYDEAIKLGLEIRDVYKEDLLLKERIIKSQIALTDINKEIITSQGETIVLQDRKIGKIEKKNTFKNIILLGITAAGVGIAADNDNTGAAVGIAAAGILALTI